MGVMPRSIVNALVALGLAGLILATGQVTTEMVPGLDIAPQTGVIAMVVAVGLFTGLNARAGNRRVRMASAQQREDALRLTPQPGKGLLVILRHSRSGKNVGFDVNLNGITLAQLRPRQFVILPVTPGPHEVLIAVSGAPAGTVFTPASVVMGEGDVHFLETQTALGIARTTIHLSPLGDSVQLRARLDTAAMILPDVR